MKEDSFCLNYAISNRGEGNLCALLASVHTGRHTISMHKNYICICAMQPNSDEFLITPMKVYSENVASPLILFYFFFRIQDFGQYSSLHLKELLMDIVEMFVHLNTWTALLHQKKSMKIHLGN